MERDTRRLALLSAGLGIGIVTLLPVHAGLAHGFRPDVIATLGHTLKTNALTTDVLDLSQNVLLFLPLGYFVAATAGPIPKGARARLLEACLAGLMLSVAVEALQLLLPGRFCSPLDVLTNGLGAFLGGLAAVRGPLKDPQWKFAGTLAQGASRAAPPGHSAHSTEGGNEADGI